jgi:hypothetical protein
LDWAREDPFKGDFTRRPTQIMAVLHERMQVSSRGIPGYNVKNAILWIFDITFAGLGRWDRIAINTY